MPVPEAATITYESFAELWKRLVSRRKARKFDVDCDRVWVRLAAGNPIRFRRPHERDAESGEHRPAGGGSVDEKARRSIKRSAAVAVGIADLEPAPLPTKATRSTVAKRRADRQRGAAGRANTKTSLAGPKTPTAKSRKGRRTAVKAAGRR